jgi:hypothetical protein
MKLQLEELTVTPIGHEILHKFLKQTVHCYGHTVLPFTRSHPRLCGIFGEQSCTGAWLALSTCILPSNPSIALYSISSGACTVSSFEAVAPEDPVTPHP